MKVILMRHGEAEEGVFPDSARPLTDFGSKQAQQTADYIATHYQPDALVVSPFKRAQQTMAQLAKHYSHVKVITQDNITPSDDPKAAFDKLADIDAECLLVVCHMSIVAKLASLLTGDSFEGFSLAEARVFELEFLMTGMAKEIDRFVPDQP